MRPIHLVNSPSFLHYLDLGHRIRFLNIRQMYRTHKKGEAMDDLKTFTLATRFRDMHDFAHSFADFSIWIACPWCLYPCRKTVALSLQWITMQWLTVLDIVLKFNPFNFNPSRAFNFTVWCHLSRVDIDRFCMLPQSPHELYNRHAWPWARMLASSSSSSQHWLKIYQYSSACTDPALQIVNRILGN